MPFTFEGGRRNKVAREGIEQLSIFVDSIIIIPNDKLDDSGKILWKMPLKSRWSLTSSGAKVSLNMISKDGLLTSTHRYSHGKWPQEGAAMMGIGKGSGEDRAEIVKKPSKAHCLTIYYLKMPKVYWSTWWLALTLPLKARTHHPKVHSLVDIVWRSQHLYGVAFGWRHGRWNPEHPWWQRVLLTMFPKAPARDLFQMPLAPKKVGSRYAWTPRMRHAVIYHKIHPYT